MSVLSTYLKLDKTHNILICPVHQCVVMPDSVKQHFEKQHRADVAPGVRAQLQEEVDELCTTTCLKTSYTEFQFTSSDGKPLHEIPYLALQPSLICNLCNHVCTKESALKTMKGHLRTSHSISSNHHTVETQSGPLQYYSGYSQRYFVGLARDRSSNFMRSFEVIPATATKTPAHFNPTDAEPLQTDAEPLQTDTEHDTRENPAANSIYTIEQSDGTKRRRVEQLQAQLGDATVWARTMRQERLNTIPQGQSIQTNPWLAYTRFLEVLPERIEDALLYTAIPKRDSEPALYFLNCSVKSMVRTWQNSTAVTSRYIRIRVMQEDMTDVPRIPLETYQHFSLQHALPLQKIFIFFYRVFVEQRPCPRQLQLSSRQHEAWTCISVFLDEIPDKLVEIDAAHTRTELAPFESLLHRFWLSLIEQTCLFDDMELAFIVPVAFQVVSSRTKKLQQVYNFATDITALKKMIRLASVQKFQEEIVAIVQDSSDVPSDEAVSSLEVGALVTEQDKASAMQGSEEFNRSTLDTFKTWVYNYLTTEYPTPMNWLINTARYLSRFRYGENLDAFVAWNGDTITLRGIRTSFSKFQSMVHNEHTRALFLMCQLAFVTESSSLPAIPWDDLIEDPSNTTPGFSLFSAENKVLSSHANFVQEQLVKSICNGTNVLLNDPKNPQQIQKYAEVVQEFLDVLLGLVHFTSGQPARGTELLSIHHENPLNGMLRNIFLYDGLVAIVPQYHKGYNRDKSLKVVYRFLPQPIGSLLVHYLWLIRPFYTLVQHGAPEAIQQAHLYRATSSLLWSDSTGNQHTTSKILQRIIQRATEKWMLQRINLSTMRHLIIAFGRWLDSKGNIPAELSKEEIDEIVDEAEAEEREMQAGHSAVTATSVYAVDIAQVLNKKFDRAHGQFKVSVKWHNALGFDAQSVPDDLYPAPASSASDLAERVQCDYRKLLRANFGDKAMFRPKQEQVIRAIMGGETVVVFVAGTGAGKSLAFLLPACYPNYGQTILVVPLAALRDDIVTQCAKHGIRTSTWTDGHCDQSATIILATPECLSQQPFVEMAHRLGSTGKLERIVVDECHYVLLPDHAYRPHLLELRRLARYGVRLTLLTATLPFKEQVDAFRLLGVPTDTVPFRVSTSRPNLAWQVNTLSLSHDSTLSDMAIYLKSQLPHHPKILAYVEFASTAKQLAEELGCYVYHGQMSVEERRRNQDAFRTSKGGILVATAAYLVGVHVLDIRAVFWFGLPDHIISLIQGGGRGGRDGEKCIVRVLLSPQLPNHHYKKAEPGTKALVDRFIQERVRHPTCRRRVLSEYLDNESDRLTCRAAEERCDICEAQMGQAVCHNTPTPQTPVRNASRTLPPNPITDPPSAMSTVTPASPAILRPTLASTPRPFASSSSPSYELSGNQRRQERDAASSFETPLPRRHGQYLQDNVSSPLARNQGLSTTPRRLSNINSSQTAMTSFQVARQQRQLNFNADALGEADTARTDLFLHQLPATQQFWVNHCAVCFCDHGAYQHQRETCSKLIGSLVKDYRAKIRASSGWGKGMCWTCLMPQNSCPKWSPTGTGVTVTRPDGHDTCVSRHAILDTWVYFWDKCPGARQPWLERIRAVHADFEVANNSHLRDYFTQVVQYGSDFKCNRLCLDVNWLTQTFFIHGTPHDLLAPTTEGLPSHDE